MSNQELHVSSLSHSVKLAMLSLVVVVALAGCGTQRDPTKFTSGVKKAYTTGCVGTGTKDQGLPAAGHKKSEVQAKAEATLKDFCSCTYTAIKTDVKFADFKRVQTTLTDEKGQTSKLKDKAAATWKKIQRIYNTCQKSSGFKGS
ncbi:MAG TPA: hypothetical protein VGM93_12095 [Acidimicrobiales bacterium]